MKRFDPKTYAKMAEPFETVEDFIAAGAAFARDVERARKKHRIAEVMLILGVTSKDRPGMLVSSLAFGDSEKAPTLAAHAFEKFAQPVIEQAEWLRRTASGETKSEFVDSKEPTP